MESLPKVLQVAFDAAMEENKYFEWTVKSKPDSMEIILTWTKLETVPIDRNVPLELGIMIGRSNNKYKFFEWNMKEQEGMTNMFLIWKERDQGTRSQYRTNQSDSEVSSRKRLLDEDLKNQNEARGGKRAGKRRIQPDQQQNRHQDDEKIQVHVKDVSKKTYTITVEKEAIIEDVKIILATVTGIPVDQQRLFFAVTFQWILSILGLYRHLKELFHTHTNLDLKFEFDSGLTSFSAPFGQYRDKLVVKNLRKQLEDGRSLGDYYIRSECTMHLQIRLRGD